MKIGLRKSPHLDTLIQGIAAVGGVEFVSEYNGGADFYLTWGWPQAEQVARDLGGRDRDIICLDAHPFALKEGAKTGSRIFQLGNWGHMARYPAPSAELARVKISRPARGALDPNGPTLVLGHVSSTEQLRKGLVDVWYTPGGDAWLADELKQPGRKFRPHPRMWDAKFPQPSLAEDLRGCCGAVAWNSTAAIHARMLGYPAQCVEEHGWAHFDIDQLAELEVSQQELRSGEYWAKTYRPWLESLGRPQC